jgi:hypothetical protein
MWHRGIRSKSGYWPSDTTFYVVDICYVFKSNKYIDWDSNNYYNYYAPERIIEFSDLIIPEESSGDDVFDKLNNLGKQIVKGYEEGVNSVNKDEHMTAEEA